MKVADDIRIGDEIIYNAGMGKVRMKVVKPYLRDYWIVEQIEDAEDAVDKILSGGTILKFRIKRGP